MTCHDARDQFSALVDDGLPAGERAVLDAHLATCADCRRELERFRRTVSLLHAVAPVRAPAGFVDRVLEAARPVPWPRRLLRGLFVPWPVKLPIEAAAIMLVAVGVALVYRATPELQQSAQVETYAPTAARVPDSAAQAPAPMSRETDVARQSGDALRDQGAVKEQPPAKTREAKDAAEAPKSEPAAPAPAKAPEGGALSRETHVAPERRQESRAKDEQPAAKPAPPPVVAEPRAMAKQNAPSPSQSAPGARSDMAPAPASRQPTAALAAAPSDVSGLLAVGDRDAALRQVGELITRLGGTETRRVDGANGPIVELTIARDAYAELARELARIGRWRTTREPAALPDQVRVVLQIIS